MGALAHYLETAGIPTTQISLIREHSVIIQPPRVVWVPFVLGRPLGLPGDPAFQRRVLRAALELFNVAEGPVLVDFPDDIPKTKNILDSTLTDLACPVNFTPSSKGKNETERLIFALNQEIDEFRSWYDLGLTMRGYTTMAYFSPDSAFRLLSDFVLGQSVQLSENIDSTATALRLAAQDIKAFYFEAVLARPDLSLPEPLEFTRWFWQKTVAGDVLRRAREMCLSSNDQQLRMTGGMLLIPMDQA